MRKLSPALLTLALLGTAGPTPAADDPRAIIRRAIEAVGGDELLMWRGGEYMKTKGMVWPPGVKGVGVSVVGEIQSQGDRRQRLVLKASISGMEVELQLIVNEVKGWKAANGTVQEFTETEKAQARLRAYTERVQQLVPLLRDKGFTLRAQGESKVEGQPVLGVQVVHKGYPDVLLQFDKKTGLLTKVSYRGPLRDGKEGLNETLFQDYRAMDFAATDERLLKEARVAVTGPALLEFLRGKLMRPARRKQVEALIRQLGDESFDVREKAVEDLVALGEAAIPSLRVAAKDTDVEVARRAKHCLHAIGEKTRPGTVRAAVHLLALRRPPGSVAVLLDLLPGADEAVAVEVRAALYHLARRDGKPDPVLVKALESKDPVRRAAAVAALGKDGGAYAGQPGRRIYLPGRKLAMKLISYEAGKKSAELETLDYQVFNRFDEKLFAKP